MQALVQYSKKLEPLPDRFRDIDRGAFTVPECQTRVDIIPVERVRCGGGGCRPAANVVGRLRERPETADPCTAIGGKVEHSMSPYSPPIGAGSRGR